MLKRFLLGFVATYAAILPLNMAHAADYDHDTMQKSLTPDLRGTQDEPGEATFGNIHMGGDFLMSGHASGARLPLGNFGGKYAYEGGVKEIGFQFDGDMDFTHSSAFGLNMNGNDFGVAAYDTAAHITYMPSAQSKIGAYIGTAGLNFMGSAGGSAMQSGGVLGAGVEGLYAMQNGITAQARAAVLGPTYGNASILAGGVGANANSFKLDAPLGFAASVGVAKKLTSNISGRLDANALLWPSLNYANYQIAATGQYTLDEAPLSFGATVGYDVVNSAAFSSGGFLGKLRATYSFGGPSSGASGKLFRSGLTGLLN